MCSNTQGLQPNLHSFNNFFKSHSFIFLETETMLWIGADTRDCWRDLIKRPGISIICKDNTHPIVIYVSNLLFSSECSSTLLSCHPGVKRTSINILWILCSPWTRDNFTRTPISLNQSCCRGLELATNLREVFAINGFKTPHLWPMCHRSNFTSTYSGLMSV